MIYALILVFLAVFLSGISQVLLKIGSQHKIKKDWSFAVYLNEYSLIAYGLLLIVTVISIIALHEVSLKMFYAIASLNFVVVLILSFVFLNEKIEIKNIIGIVFIIVGIFVFNL